jgi:hypothetical protein
MSLQRTGGKRLPPALPGGKRRRIKSAADTRNLILQIYKFL